MLATRTIIIALLGVLASNELLAQRRVQTPFFTRMDRYMDRGTLLGGLTGAGLSAFANGRGTSYRYDIMVGGMLGAAVGNLGGMFIGLTERAPGDTLPAPLPPGVLRSPFPVYAIRMSRASDYAGFGGRIGASVGVITGALLARDDRARGVIVVAGGVGGWTAGMAAGGITWVARHQGH